MLWEKEGKLKIFLFTRFWGKTSEALFKTFSMDLSKQLSASLEENSYEHTLFLKKPCFLIIVGHWTIKNQTLSKRFGHECPNSILRAHRKISRRKVSLGKIFILSTSDIRPNFFCLFVGKRLDLLVKNLICMSIWTFPGNFFSLK